MISQRKRKRVEEIFGWVKMVGGGRKLRSIGVGRNAMWATLTATAYNLVQWPTWSWLGSETRPLIRSPRAARADERTRGSFAITMSVVPVDISAADGCYFSSLLGARSPVMSPILESWPALHSGSCHHGR